MVEIGEFTTVDKIPDNLVFSDLSQDASFIREYIPNFDSGGVQFDNDFDSFFVETLDGDYGAVYGMYGIVPWLDREVCRIK